MTNYKGISQQIYDETPDLKVVDLLYDIDKIIVELNNVKSSPSREIALVVTKLQEAQLWLTQVG